MRIDTLAVLRLVAMLGLVLPAGLAAQDSGQRLYQVEVVIFAQPEGTSVERGPRQSREPGEARQRAGLGAGLEDEFETGDEEAPAEPAAAGNPVAPLDRGYTAPSAPLALANVAARLNTGGYRLLWHQAWVQPASDATAADLNVLAALGRGRTSPDLGGAISLWQGRFLHLGMELEWRSAAGLRAELRQRRRVRTGVDQYFDHPRIGVIAVVTELPATR